MQIYTSTETTLAYLHEQCGSIAWISSTDTIRLVIPTIQGRPSNPSHSIVLSQRNNHHHPSDQDEPELEAAKDGKAALPTTRSNGATGTSRGREP